VAAIGLIETIKAVAIHTAGRMNKPEAISTTVFTSSYRSNLHAILTEQSSE